MKIVYVIHGSDNDGIIGAFNNKSAALANVRAYVGDVNAPIKNPDYTWQFYVMGPRRNASVHLVPLDVDLDCLMS